MFAGDSMEDARGGGRAGLGGHEVAWAGQGVVGDGGREEVGLGGGSRAWREQGHEIPGPSESWEGSRRRLRSGLRLRAQGGGCASAEGGSGFGRRFCEDHRLDGRRESSSQKFHREPWTRRTERSRGPFNGQQDTRGQSREGRGSSQGCSPPGLAGSLETTQPRADWFFGPNFSPSLSLCFFSSDFAVSPCRS